MYMLILSWISLFALIALLAKSKVKQTSSVILFSFIITIYSELC